MVSEMLWYFCRFRRTGSRCALFRRRSSSSTAAALCTAPADGAWGLAASRGASGVAVAGGAACGAHCVGLQRICGVRRGGAACTGGQEWRSRAARSRELARRTRGRWRGACGGQAGAEQRGCYGPTSTPAGTRAVEDGGEMRRIEVGGRR